MGPFWTFDTDCLGTCGNWNQDTTCKTKLFQSKVVYLGHKISKVATFLGFAGYYRTFIQQNSELTNQLNLIKKTEKFLLNKEIEGYFIELKKAFTKGGIQAFPDFGVGD